NTAPPFFHQPFGKTQLRNGLPWDAVGANGQIWQTLRMGTIAIAPIHEHSRTAIEQHAKTISTGIRLRHQRRWFSKG
ncbi:MAG: hypothetical protein AAF753_10300, partial [Pseudomonadota bacterium]